MNEVALQESAIEPDDSEFEIDPEEVEVDQHDVIFKSFKECYYS